jgi:hypothetical protein
MSASSADSFESVSSSSINSPATNVNANANANFNVNTNPAAYAGPGNMNMGPTNLALLGGKGEDLTRIFNALKEVEVRSDDRVFLVDDKPPLAKALPQEGGRRTKRSRTKRSSTNQRKVTRRKRTVGRARARTRTHKRRM